MKIHRFIVPMVMLLGIVGAQAQTTGYAARMVKSQGRAWSQDKAWDYVSGFVTKAVIKYAQQYPNDALASQAYSWCKKYADNALNANGSFRNFKKGSLDNISSGKVLIDLYAMEEQKAPGSGSKYKAAANYLYNYMVNEYPRINIAPAVGCFIHKDRYPYQMWLDGQFMGAAFYAEYVAMFDPGNSQAWSDIALQFITIHIHTYDSAERLNYHGWSAKPDDASSFWANRSDPYKGCSKEFWGRGMGWYFAALVDVLELMPATHADYPAILDIYRQVAEGLCARQDAASGVWYQLLRYDDTFVSNKGRHNYLEASASSMFTYGLLKGLRLGLLDEDAYRDAAEKAYLGLIDTFITATSGDGVSIHSICRSAGLGPASDPSRDGSADYYLDGSDVTIVSDEGKGIGSFIMASLEYELSHTLSAPAIATDAHPATPLYNLQGIPVDRPLPGTIYIQNGRKVVIRNSLESVQR